MNHHHHNRPCAEVAAPRPRRKLRREKRATSIRNAMRDLRRRRHAAGLNSSGKPLGKNAKFRNKKYRA
jgi:antitoxin (DNA-binding transcriptional repressor) of toxin-antitoxin stability system